MLKKGFFYACLFGIVVLSSSSFKPLVQEHQPWFHLDSERAVMYTLPSQNQKDYVSHQIPFTGKYFIAFKEALASKESQGRYRLVNTLGYIGKYQFGISALKAVGVNNTQGFLNNPRMQEKAFVALLSKHKWILQEEISKYEGEVIGGVLVTESGILAAAHLGGAGSVKRFLNTKGRRQSKDAYGTSVKTYLRDFGGYETSGIEADKNASVL